MRHTSVLLCVLVACAGDHAIEVTFDPCSPLEIAVVPGTDAREVQSVRDAVSSWSRVLPTRIDVGTVADDVPTLTVTFESGDTFYRATYWDAVGAISISRDRLDAQDYPVAIAHELGHAFGLLHVPTGLRPSVMNVGNLAIEPTDEDAAAVRERWDACAVAPRR